MNRNYALVAAVLGLVGAAFVSGRFTGNHRPESTQATGRRVLYYVDPMHPSYRSDKPGIAPDCGMALEPVYEGDASPNPQAAAAGGRGAERERQQLIGIRVAVAGISAGLRSVRTTGRIVPDDNRLYRIQAGFDGWVASLADTPPGTVVKENQALARLYGPDIRSAELNYVAFMNGIERVKQAQPDTDPKQVNASKQVSEEQLRLLGIGDKEIADLAQSHHVSNTLVAGRSRGGSGTVAHHFPSPAI